MSGWNGVGGDELKLIKEFIFQRGFVDPTWLVKSKVIETKCLHPKFATLQDEHYFCLVKRAAAEEMMLRAANRIYLDVDNEVRMLLLLIRHSQKYCIKLFCFFLENPGGNPNSPTTSSKTGNPPKGNPDSTATSSKTGNPSKDTCSYRREKEQSHVK